MTTCPHDYTNPIRKGRAREADMSTDLVAALSTVVARLVQSKVELPAHAKALLVRNREALFL